MGTSTSLRIYFRPSCQPLFQTIVSRQLSKNSYYCFKKWRQSVSHKILGIMLSSQPRYIGETKDQLRDGFGVYNYPNSFFKYEGEWKKGKKHGHGKMAMKDGSFYEGQFSNGEMSGIGIRKWAHNNNIYEGEFLRGELCGKGIMRSADGSVYEGDWTGNMREGDGRLTGCDGSVYKGSFYKHKKHGDGCETFSDGRIYEGSFVCGMKQGHGIMQFADGSVYDGQWRSDFFNGQGSLLHCSGVSYEGVWISGRPEVDATELCIEGEAEIELEQGQALELIISCVTSDGDVSSECGRVLQITAGVRSAKTSIGTSSKASFSVDSTAEQTEDSLISTPFGFDVEPYLLLENTTTEQQQPQHETALSSSDSIGQNKSGDKAGVLSPIVDHSPDSGNKADMNPEVPDDVFIAQTEKPFDGARVTFQEKTEERFISYEAADATQLTSLEDDGQDLARQDVPSGLIFRNLDGRVAPRGIILPPLPSTTGSLLRSTPDSEGRLSVNNRGKRSDASVSSNIHQSSDKDKKKTKPESAHTENEKSKDKDGKKRKEKKEDRLIDDRYCKPGDYVIIVQDVTNPPFLETTLRPAYLHVKVVPKTKKPKTGGRKAIAS